MPICRSVKRAGYLIVSTDRGLVGLNINLFKTAIQSMKAQQDEGVEVEPRLLARSQQASLCRRQRDGCGQGSWRGAIARGLVG